MNNQFDANDLETSDLIVVKQADGDWVVAGYVRNIDAFVVCSEPFGTFTEARDRVSELDPENG